MLVLRNPFEKFRCLSKIRSIVVQLFLLSGMEISSDNINKILRFVIWRSKPARLLAQMQYIYLFVVDEREGSEEAMAMMMMAGGGRGTTGAASTSRGGGGGGHSATALSVKLSTDQVQTDSGIGAGFMFGIGSINEKILSDFEFCVKAVQMMAEQMSTQEAPSIADPSANQ